MGVDGGLVFHYAGFFGAVDHSHDIDIAKTGPAFAPIAMSEAIVAAGLCPCLLLHPFRHGPVEKTIEPRDPLTGGGRFNMFQEGGKTTDHTFGIESRSNLEKPFRANAGNGGPAGPGVFADFFRC